MKPLCIRKDSSHVLLKTPISLEQLFGFDFYAQMPLPSFLPGSSLPASPCCKLSKPKMSKPIHVEGFVSLIQIEDLFCGAWSLGNAFFKDCLKAFRL